MHNKNSLLLIGATSKIAEAAIDILETESDFNISLVSSSPQLVVSKKGSIIYDCSSTDFIKLKALISDIKPEFIVNCAAFTDVDANETSKALSQTLNTKLPELLARSAKIFESHLIHFSTDYIFDGKNGPYNEEARPNPISYYGKTKLAGENAIITSQAKYTLIRTNIVYGKSSSGKNDFVNWVYDNLYSNNQINVINGQWGNPTFNYDIALSLLKILQKNETGIFNVAGSEYVNRLQFAKKIAEVFRLDDNLITEIDSKELKQKAKRPEKGGLITLKSESILGMKFANLEEGLTSVMFAYANSGRMNHI